MFFMKDCLKETIISHQFPMFSTSTDNQLASKAKDSLEDRKKKGSGGSRFTWTNRQSNNAILKKLDQVLVNVKWNSKFTGSKNCFLPFSISYHSPMLVKMASLPKRKIPFKVFFTFGPIILFFSP